MIDKESAPEDFEPPHAELEASFARLRKAIESAKNEIMAEINNIIYGNDNT